MVLWYFGGKVIMYFHYKLNRIWAETGRFQAVGRKVISYDRP